MTRLLPLIILYCMWPVCACCENWVVRTVTVEEIQQGINNGRSILFVDAREPLEYAEDRVPQATNLRLRDINIAMVGPLRNVDLVVAYCVKDFRGFEVARALQEAGVKNVRIMKPFGLKGWKAAGLPTAGQLSGLSDEEAHKKLLTCAAGRCQKTK